MPEVSNLTVPSDRVAPWASLAFRDYRLFWAASLLGNIGLQMQQFANVYQVYEITGSALKLGLAGLFQAIPVLTVGLFAGTIADAVDRRKLLMLTQVLGLLLVLGMAVLTASGRIQVWHIYGMTFAASMINMFAQPSRTSLIASLVPKSHLMNGVTLNLAVQQVAIILGPMLAGILVAVFGSASAYYVNALLFAPALLCLWIMRVKPAPRDQGAPTGPSAILEGLRFVATTPILVGLIFLDTTATLFGAFRALMPVFAKDILAVGPAGLGALVSAPAIGGLVGTIGILGAGNIRRKGLMVLTSTMLYAWGLVVFGLSHWFVLSLVAAGFLGIMNSVGVASRHTTVQMVTPEHLRGRATSVHQMFSQGAPSLGYILCGGLASAVGAPLTLVIGGAVCTAVVIALALRSPQVRNYRA